MSHSNTNRLSEDQWRDATKDVAMADEILEILQDVHPEALSRGRILNRVESPNMSSDRGVLFALLEMLVSQNEIEVATVDGVAGRFYRIIQE